MSPTRPDASPQAPLGIALIGHHEKDYPRNRTIRAALQASGFRVVECHSLAPFPWRHLILAWKYFKVHRDIDIILVTEGGHRLVPLMRLWAAMTGKKTVFDPFLSRYNTRIEDRRLHAPGGMQAWISKWQDWSSTHAAKGLLFDTLEHQQYFYSRYRLNKPFAILPVGADEAVFNPAAHAHAKTASGSGAASDFEVLFYGTYIPLQGIEHILEAASVMQGKDPGIRFTLIGDGQTHADARSLANSLGLRNVAFEPFLPVGELPGRIAKADVCLGIFGATLKARNVVPNKVVQAAAMGAAIVTADTPAIRRYFRNDEDIVLVPAGNGRDLSEALTNLRAAPDRLEALRAGSRRVFEESFSLQRQAEILSAFLSATIAGR